MKEMKRNGHYEATKEFHRIGAVEKNGYYQAVIGHPLRHSIWQQRIRKMILSILDELLRNDQEISRVIDVGCGRGDFIIDIARRYPQLKKIYGCDFVKEALAIAKKEASLIEHISFQEADLLNMPFDNNSVDLTLCINVLHHIYYDDIERALSELARITNKYLVLEIKNFENVWFRRIFSNDFCGIKVYPTSATEVSAILKNQHFKLVRNDGIFMFKWLSPLIVLLYKRDT
jgi:ubiquinone/menaquinone biosynthesis C-methylase UbiE